MNAWKVIFATLVIFITGVVTGALLVSYSDRAQRQRHRIWPHVTQNRRPDNRQPGARQPFSPAQTALTPKVLRMGFLQNLDRELQLTDDQRHRIEKIISEGQQRNEQIANRVLPEIRREIQQTKERIRAVLGPDQVQRFEQLMKQRPLRRANEPTMKSDRRLRNPSRRPLPPRDLPPEGAPQPRPPADQPANP